MLRTPHDSDAFTRQQADEKDMNRKNFSLLYKNFYMPWQCFSLSITSAHFTHDLVPVVSSSFPRQFGRISRALTLVQCGVGRYGDHYQRDSGP
jgi:hypothetical protein